MAELIHGVPPESFWRFVSYKQLTAAVRCYERLLVQSGHPGARIRWGDIQTLRADTGELELSLRNLCIWIPAGETRNRVISLVGDVHELVHELDYLPMEFDIGGRQRAEKTLRRITYHAKQMRIALRVGPFTEVRHYIRLMQAFEETTRK